jgi:hypothetical protein
MIGLALSWIGTHQGTFMGLNTRAGLLGALFGCVDRLFVSAVRPSQPWIVRAVLGTGRDWVALLGLTSLALLLVGALWPLRGLYARIRDDWTLLSFGLYGATMGAVVHTFDDYPSARYPAMVVSLLILAAGAWAHVHSARASLQENRLRPAQALLAAMVLAMVLGAASIGLIYANPGWPYPHSFTWRSEALHAVLLWGWVIATVLAPALLTFLPRPPRERVEARPHASKGRYVPET